MKILITGAAGRIGTMLARALRDRHHLRGLDVAPMPEFEDAVVGDQGNFDTVLKALDGMDAVIHPGVKYEIVFGVSGSDIKRFDFEHGRKAIGYYPQDKSDSKSEQPPA